MKKYTLSVRSTATRREDPVYDNNLSKMNMAATIFTVRKVPQVVIFDNEEEEIIFLAENGTVKVDHLP
jgi:hypothetical protein